LRQEAHRRSFPSLGRPGTSLSPRSLSGPLAATGAVAEGEHGLDGGSGQRIGHGRVDVGERVGEDRKELVAGPLPPRRGHHRLGSRVPHQEGRPGSRRHHGVRAAPRHLARPPWWEDRAGGVDSRVARRPGHCRGLGLNSAIHDAHNLAWKLAVAIRGLSSDPERLLWWCRSRAPAAMASGLPARPQPPGSSLSSASSPTARPAAERASPTRSTRTVMRSQHVLFTQADREPWTYMLGYEKEREILPKADLDDGSLVYT
jgi:hypothetical protein